MIRSIMLGAALVSLAVSAAVLPVRQAHAVSICTTTDAVCTVISTGDDGSTEGTLRFAINAANTAGSAITEIDFAIPSTDPECSSSPTVCVIEPLGSELVLGKPGVTINGFTQNGNGSVGVELTGDFGATTPGVCDGTAAPDGLEIGGSNDVVEGLSFVNFCQSGIAVTSYDSGNPVDGMRIQGNDIGVTPQGTAAANGIGVSVDNFVYATTPPGPAITIGSSTGLSTPPTNTLETTLANVISGNAGDGIDVEGATDYQILGNFVGTNYGGTQPIPNGADGILTTRFDMRGTISGNVVSGNTGNGIHASGSGDQTIQGNFVGTDITGSTSTGAVAGDLGNGEDGILLDEFFGDGILHADSDTIGGSAAGEANVVSGNAQNGIEIVGATNLLVEGNFIGTDSTGVLGADLGNGADGILLESDFCGAPSEATIGGGLGFGASNTIAGNTANGVDVLGGSICSRRVIAHLARFSPHLTPPAGDSILTGNAIFGNALSGVAVGGAPDDTTQLAISQNQIHDNLTGYTPPVAGNPPTAAEIYLNGQSPLSCTTTTPDALAPNTDLVCPIITAASGGTVTVETCDGCTVELFEAKDDANDNHSGGSLTDLGTQTDSHPPCTPGTDCVNDILALVTFTGVPGTIKTLTATATDPTGAYTSEFANDISTSPTFVQVSAFSAHRSGGTVHFVWQVAANPHVVGFNLFAGTHRLTPHKVTVHRAATYRFSTTWSGHGPYMLRVLLAGGGHLSVRAGHP